MLVFNTKGTRGGYTEVQINASGGKGSRLITPAGTAPESGSSGKSSKVATDTCLVTGISFAQKERFSVVQCFNDRNYVYAFGHDPLSSMVNIQFTVFLGNCDNGGSPGLNKLVSMYKSGRLSASMAPSSVHIGLANTILEGFLIGMESSTVSQEYNLQSFEATIILPQVMGGGR